MQGMRLFHWYLLLPVSPFIETENNSSHLQKLGECFSHFIRHSIMINVHIHNLWFFSYANGKLLYSVIYPFKFFIASGLFERTIPTIWHFSKFGQSPHIIMFFFSPHWRIPQRLSQNTVFIPINRMFIGSLLDYF